MEFGLSTIQLIIQNTMKNSVNVNFDCTEILYMIFCMVHKPKSIPETPEVLYIFQKGNACTFILK